MKNNNKSHNRFSTGKKHFKCRSKTVSTLVEKNLLDKFWLNRPFTFLPLELICSTQHNESLNLKGLGFRRLPTQIRYLKSLQVLNIHDTVAQNTTFPEQIRLLPHLRHIFMNPNPPSSGHRTHRPWKQRDDLREKNIIFDASCPRLSDLCVESYVRFLLSTAEDDTDNCLYMNSSLMEMERSYAEAEAESESEAEKETLTGINEQLGIIPRHCMPVIWPPYECSVCRRAITRGVHPARYMVKFERVAMVNLQLEWLFCSAECGQRANAEMAREEAVEMGKQRARSKRFAGYYN